MKGIKFLAALLLLATMSGCASNTLKGRWLYQDNGVIIGLNIQNAKNCELSLSKFLSKDAKKSCRFELSKASLQSKAAKETKKEQSYLVYLVDDAGRCDPLPDFEFSFGADTGVLTFLVGDQPFLMQRSK